MGLLDPLKHAKNFVADKAHDVAHVADKVVTAVAAAPVQAAHAATQAIAGVRELPKAVAKAAPKLVHKAVSAAKHVGSTATRLGKAAVRDAKAGARLAKDGVRHVVKAVAPVAKSVGKWAWNHKAEIGFWVATTALMLAIPVTGGASGALEGGLLAARAASVGVKVAEMGRAGAGAVRIARAGATAVQGARGAVAATRAGSAVARGGAAIGRGRVALGGTKAGKLMLAAEPKVTAASTVIAGLNFGDTAVKYSKGKASKKDLALATLGFAPAGVSTVRGVAARRAATASSSAAKVATGRLDELAATTSGATEEAAHVARVAPSVGAPRTAGAAAETREGAADAAQKVQRLRTRAAVTRTSADADDAITASTLSRELDDVAAKARAARTSAATTEELAPESLTPAARAARTRLDEVEAIATRAKQDISVLATTQQRADRVADGAGKVTDALGTTSLHANLVNNGVKALNDRTRNGGGTLTDASFARNIVTVLLGRNARSAAAAAAPAG